MKPAKKHIGLIGYGHVGSHLSHILAKSEDLSLKIYNRSSVPEEQLPSQALFTRDLNELSGSELILIAVKDDAIIPILEQIEERIAPDTIVCHCSGSIPSTVIKPFFNRFGVLYPLQTFSKGKKIDYSQIPVFITGSDSDVRTEIKEIARYISPRIHAINDRQRISLHIAAVFSCNYTNALYAIGQKICKDHDLDFGYLVPLIEETAEKIKQISPEEAQTGPAVRGDWEVIHHHESYLAEYDQQISYLYRELADYISKNI